MWKEYYSQSQQSFSKYLMRTYYVPGCSPGDVEANLKKLLSFGSLRLSGER